MLEQLILNNKTCWSSVTEVCH